MPNFSHLNADSQFPDIDNVNVFQFDNKFDYARFDGTQMHLQLCDVPWDAGEAHVGQRTISGIGNVVYFESPEERDAWFDAIPDAEPGQDPTGKCFRWSTKFKELHSEQYIDIDVPYNVAALFNYLVVTYEPFASADDFVKNETGTGKLKWFWFVREVEFRAPNTTRLKLLDDAFQTWIYDINVSGMVLERGHAPMFQTKASAYLQNPVANNHGLLTADANYGSADIVAHVDALGLNAGDMWCCIATSANPAGTWGTKADETWTVPTTALYANNGVPSYYVFAIEPNDLSTFLSTIQQSFPQFAQTVQGVFFIEKELVITSSSFTFAQTTCWSMTSTRKSLNLTTLTKEFFGYDSDYAEIAKLYTSPYAHIEIVDESGSVEVVKVEDTSGTLDLSLMVSLAYPYVNIQCHIMGIGGSAQASLTYRNITAQTFNIQGRWYDTLRQWDVPTFAVISNAYKEADYSAYFDRKQASLDASTAYSNATASSATDKTNADANADTEVANTALQVAANAAITSRSNTSALSDSNLSNALSQAVQAWEAGYTYETTNNDVDSKYASASVGAAGGVAGSVISGAASGGLIGAGLGLISGAVSGATSLAQTAIASNLMQSQANAAVRLSQEKVEETSQNNLDRTGNQNGANSDNATTANTASTGAAANNAATTKENATRSKNTIDANASRELSRAQSAIANRLTQTRLNAPIAYGATANGSSAATKPMALFANVVTQSKSAIAAAGDEFLRYGYMYDMQWEFDGNWNIGKYFTYWKLKDFWVSDLQVPDLYMDKIRFFLFGGVTIWRKPEYMGKVTIYDNFN